MKHLRILILIPLTLLLTGSVTQQHLMVVARKNVALTDSPGTANLVAYWELSDATDSHGSLDLSSSANPTFVAGQVGNAVDIDGVTDEDVLYINDTAAIDITGALTISCWFRPESTSASVTGVVTKDVRQGSGNASYSINNGADDNARFWVSGDGSSVVIATGTTTLNTNTWYHLVGVYVPSTSVKIYVNGSLEATNTTSVPASIYNSTAFLRIGQDYNNTLGTTIIDCKVDEVGIWSEELTADEIAWLYNSGSGRAYSDL